MKMHNRQHILELISQAQRLDDGPSKLAILDEAVRRADALSDLSLGYETRLELLSACSGGGSPEKALPALSWCLAQFDRDPARFSESEILKRYHDVIIEIADIPQIPKKQIIDAIKDLERRQLMAGYGRKSLKRIRLALAYSMGDMEEHDLAYHRWKKLPSDNLRDNSDSEFFTDLVYLELTGRHQELIERGHRLLDGTDRGKWYYGRALSIFLIPLLKLGRLEEAAQSHVKCYPLIARDHGSLGSICNHIEFLALTDNLVRGLRLFQVHLPWAMSTYDQSDRYTFALASRFLFHRLRASGKDSVKLKLPLTFPLADASEIYQVSELIAWFESDFTKLGKRFDERNGNNWCIHEIEENRALDQWVKPYPLPKLRQRKTIKTTENRLIDEPGVDPDGGD